MERVHTNVGLQFVLAGYGLPWTSASATSTRAEAAGNVHCLDLRIPHQSLPDPALAALHKREDARVHPELLNGRSNGGGDDLAGAKMGRMSLK